MAKTRKEQAGDLWRRARTNAMAHRLAAEKSEGNEIRLALAVAILTVIPIVAVALMLDALGSGSGQAISPRPATPLPLRTVLGLVAIIANGAGLCLFIFAKDLRFGERISHHRAQMASYGLLAQKARRIDEEAMDKDEEKYLLRSLQETFETLKNSQYEPDDETFTKAQAVVKKLAPLPFDLKP